VEKQHLEAAINKESVRFNHPQWFKQLDKESKELKS